MAHFAKLNGENIVLEVNDWDKYYESSDNDLSFGLNLWI